MDINDVAKTLKELGHTTRLQIFKAVVRAGHQGIAVGSIQDKLDIPGSTLSHHIAALTSAGLMFQRREGRILYCVARYEQLESVLRFLMAECCVDEKSRSV